MTTYIVQQHTGHQFEVVENGEFATQAEAVAAVQELETNLGWRDMRVVADNGPRYNLSGRMLTGDDAHEVVFVGQEGEASDEE